MILNKKYSETLFMKNAHVIALIMLCLNTHIQAMEITRDQQTVQTAAISVNDIESQCNAQLETAASSESKQALNEAFAAIRTFRTAKQKFDYEIESLQENQFNRSRHDALFKDVRQAQSHVYAVYINNITF